MKNLEDSSKAPASIINSEAAKLRAIKHMLQELRQVAVQNGTNGNFWLIEGFAEGIIDRMLQSDEGDEFSWLGYVTERIEKFNASFNNEPKQSLREMIDEAIKSPLSFGSSSRRMF